jgi:environmental stress-induced protein Ves
MTFKLLTAATRTAAPWRNGRGVTCEIAVAPIEASLETFLWRVSTAEVHDPGPFSHFEGIDRVLTILSGRLALTVKGRSAVMLDETSPPFSFPGDVPSHGDPIGGLVTDINVMVRRGRAACAVRSIQPGCTTPTAPAWLFVARAAGRLTAGATSFTLRPFDAIQAAPPHAVPIVTDAPGVLVELTELP